MKTLYILISLLCMFSSLHAYESEEKLEALIIGKVAKYITWEDESSSTFSIATLDNNLFHIFKELYEKKQIKGKNVSVEYIENISKIGNPNILYISKDYSSKLNDILMRTKSKNILTISNIRGFAEKNGILQIGFIKQKPKLKINIDTANQENIKIRAALLRIADVVKGAENE